ncbi:PilN domain-containing protein [Patescibacteria group bacterium]
MKGGSFFLSLGIFLAIILGAYTGYNYWQNSKVETEIKLFDKKIVELQDDLVKLEIGEIEETIIAKQKLDELQADTVIWSQVIKDIQDTMPTKKGKELINILSYSGASTKEITLSLETLKGSKNPYFDVADFIRSFDDSKFFIEGFVPSLAATLDEDGNPIISFNFSGKYVVDADFVGIEIEESEVVEERVEEEEVDEELESLLEAVEDTEEVEEEESSEEAVEEPGEETSAPPTDESTEEELEEVISEILEESLETEEAPVEEEESVVR